MVLEKAENDVGGNRNWHKLVTRRDEWNYVYSNRFGPVSFLTQTFKTIRNDLTKIMILNALLIDTKEATKEERHQNIRKIWNLLKTVQLTK